MKDTCPISTPTLKPRRARARSKRVRPALVSALANRPRRDGNLDLAAHALARKAELHLTGGLVGQRLLDQLDAQAPPQRRLADGSPLTPPDAERRGGSRPG